MGACRLGSTVVAVGLMAAHIPSARAADGLKSQFDKIVEVQQETSRRLKQELEVEMTEAAEQRLLDRYQAETSKNLEMILDLVGENPKDPEVVGALRFVIETAGRGPGDEAYRAMDQLLRDHIRDAGMGEVCGRIFHFVHAPVAESILRAVLATHPNRQDRGVACLSLAECLRMRADMARRVRRGIATVDHYVHRPFQAATERLVATVDLEALDREADALLERVVAEFADVRDWYTPNRTIGAVAEGELFAARNLTVGKVAPEVEGKDHESKPFALSDYRGKVVVLTFSANWCGPCVGMYPEERELVKTHEGDPFALVSVNSDAELGTLKESIASGEITWRCWWDGGMDGPITTRWGVIAIPAVFVLDQSGTIRFKDVRGEELKAAVAALLSEASRK